MNQINVIDSIMGSGKTNYIHNYFRQNREKHFIYVTPYIEEIERIKQICPYFKEPNEDNPAGVKQADFITLLRRGESIATTHQLFKNLPVDKEILKRIKEYGYILVMDEMLEVVEKVKASEFDIEEISKYCEIDEKTNRLVWKRDDYKGDHSELKRKVNSNEVIKYSNSELLWIFPKKLLAAFDVTYILTFLFNGSKLEQFLKIYGFSWNMNYVRNGELIRGQQPLTEEKKKYQKLINIYGGSKNAIGDEYYALSHSWWSKNDRSRQRGKKKDKNQKRTEKTGRDRVMSNAYGYLRNDVKAVKDEILWTTFKCAFKHGGNKGKEPNIKGRWQEDFCPCNARATNKWQTRTKLVYLINVLPDPTIERWFSDQGGHLDRRQYALSMMLQWIWRSAIRKGEPIDIFIPSKRMREILTEWLYE